jgi:hypothetical protein
MRVLSVGRKVAQSIDFVCPLSLHNCTESGETFLDMFCYDKLNAERFSAFFLNTFGFKKHLCLLIADGAAQAHHMGTSGHASTYGCTHCTCHKG